MTEQEQEGRKAVALAVHAWNALAGCLESADYDAFSSEYLASLEDSLANMQAHRVAMLNLLAPLFSADELAGVRTAAERLEAALLSKVGN